MVVPFITMNYLVKLIILYFIVIMVIMVEDYFDEILMKESN